jgi:hypothetical protein
LDHFRLSEQVGLSAHQLCVYRVSEYTRAWRLTRTGLPDNTPLDYLILAEQVL